MTIYNDNNCYNSLSNENNTESDDKLSNEIEIAEIYCNFNTKSNMHRLSIKTSPASLIFPLFGALQDATIQAILLALVWTRELLIKQEYKWGKPSRDEMMSVKAGEWKFFYFNKNNYK